MTKSDAPPDSPPRTSLAHLPTPLQLLENVSAEVGGPRIWVKRDDLTEGVAGGNKIRKLEFSVAQALGEGANLLMTAGAKQSNHCRATASVAARLGLGCHLVLAGKPEEPPFDGNLLLDDLMGASVTYIRPEEIDQLPEIYGRLGAELEREGKRPFAIPLGATDAVGVWGYIECARELKDDFARHGISPSHVVCPVGTGGTYGGLMLGALLHGLETRVLGVSVSRPEEVCLVELEELLESWKVVQASELDVAELRPEILDGYIGPGYGRADPHVYDTIRRVARAEGLVLDPVYTGKTFDALLQEITAGRFVGSSDIVFLHAGGIYGAFPHRQRFF